MSRAVLAAGLVLVLAPGALADGPPAGAIKKDWTVTVGGGGLYAPDYQGSDDYEFRALPYIRVQYQDWLTLSVPEGLKVAVVDESGFKAGVLAGYRFDRDAADNIALAGWGDVDGAFELGAFADYKIEAIKLSLDARQGISGDDTGLIAALSVRYETRIAGAVVSLGPKVSWVDDDYAQTYFGITPAQAAASVLGYTPYAADGGIKDYGLGFTVVVPLGDAWSLTGLASVSRLTGDAADSPIVATEGSETQVTLGLFAGYRF
ncbi:MAG: MipA/OmpV family protein [Micropepsaceae bacterium]